MSEKESAGFASTGRKSEQGPKFMIEEVPAGGVSIKVVGIGGCGGNIVDYMLESGLSGVDYVCLNTDKQALKRCNSPSKLVIGQRVTQGYGTGSNPEVGRESALENTEELTDLLADADMVFIVVGLGGGTGTGAAPVVGSLAKQMGALTVVAAVKPYKFEGQRRGRVADEGFQAVLEQVDTAIEIPNELLLDQVEAGAGFFDSFCVANRIAMQILRGITDIINQPGVMNSDFADIRAIFEDAGLSVVGSAQFDGREAATQAARGALEGLMVDPGQLKKSKKILVNITGSAQFSMQDASAALDLLRREFDDDAELIIGAVRDDTIEDHVRIMVVASSFDPAACEGGAAEKSAQPAEPVGQDVPFWGSEESQEPNGSASFEAEDDPVLEPVEEAELLRPDQEQEPDPIVYQHLDSEVEFEPSPGLRVAEQGDYGRERPSQRLPSNGGPLDFMPPPNIRADDSDTEQVEVRRRSFFRRHSIFR